MGKEENGTGEKKTSFTQIAEEFWGTLCTPISNSVGAAAPGEVVTIINSGTTDDFYVGPDSNSGTPFDLAPGDQANFTPQEQMTYEELAESFRELDERAKQRAKADLAAIRNRKPNGPPEFQRACSCTLPDLMTHGCKCGGA